VTASARLSWNLRVPPEPLAELMALQAPQPLEPQHSTADFDCGGDGLNSWLQQRALANQGSTGVDTNLVTWSRVTSILRISMARRGPGSPPYGLTFWESSRAAPLTMAVSLYRVTPARIGNSSGLRLPAVFYRDHPQFAGVAGQAEVLDDRTLLLRFEPEAEQQGETSEDSLILGLFLDFLSRQALTADPDPLFYSEAMAADDAELLAGVTVDAADERKASACC